MESAHPWAPDTVKAFIELHPEVGSGPGVREELVWNAFEVVILFRFKLGR